MVGENNRTLFLLSVSPTNAEFNMRFHCDLVDKAIMEGVESERGIMIQ